METPSKDKIQEVIIINSKKDIRKVFPLLITGMWIIGMLLIVIIGVNALYYSGKLQEKELRIRTEFAIITGTGLIVIISSFLTLYIWKEFRSRGKALQKEKEISGLKSDFVSIASHEFRTPLSSILLSLSLIEKYAKNHDEENVIKHSRKIKNAVGNLTNILEDFVA